MRVKLNEMVRRFTSCGIEWEHVAGGGLHLLRTRYAQWEHVAELYNEKKDKNPTEHTLHTT